MSFNYFKEPTGIFTMVGGFAMGCHSSAICTDILLLTREIKVFFKLRENSLLSTVKRYLRFRDDVNSKIVGTKEDINKTLDILLKTYPSEIDYNVEIFILKNSFLDFRFFTTPESKSLILSVNRKKETKFDIVRGTSKTNPMYLNSATFNAAYTTIRNTNNNFNKNHEKKVYETILTKREHSKAGFHKALRLAEKRDLEPKSIDPEACKKYSGKHTYDSYTQMHKFIQKLVSISELPETLNTPIVVGYKKTIEYAFKKKEFYTKLVKTVNEDS